MVVVCGVGGLWLCDVVWSDCLCVFNGGVICGNDKFVTEL